MIDIQKYNSEVKPTWCPGCGNFGIHIAVKKALSELDISPRDTLMSFDIGCNGNGADKINVNGFKGLHGRSVPLAIGVKLANRKLTVIADIGDGGTLHEGIDHLIHAIRSNYNITILIHNNQNFALTTGQATATTQDNKKMYGLPNGRPERDINIAEMVLSLNATFVSRAYSGDIVQLTKILKKAIQHKGCSIVEVMQYCPTYNKEASPKWFQEHIEKIEKPFKTKEEAIKASIITKKIATGILYKNSKVPTFYDQLQNRKNLKTELIDEVKSFNIDNLLNKFK